LSGEYLVWAIEAGPASTTTDATFAPPEELDELLELDELEELLELDELLLELDELLETEELLELDELLIDELLELPVELELEPPPPHATKPAVARAKRQNCSTRMGFTCACMMV